MKNVKPMRIVLIEDDVIACKAFDECDEHRDDIDIIGMTGKSDEGLKLTKHKLPDAVILDLELSWGKGSGIGFLKELQKVSFVVRPIIIVTTENNSPATRALLHKEYAVDFTFWKFQEDYSADMVIDHLLEIHTHGGKCSGVSPQLQSLKSPEDIENGIKQRIKAELDMFAMSNGYVGREIAEQGLLFLITKGKAFNGNIFHELANMFGTDYNNITRNLRRAINDAWLNHPDIDLLAKAYTAPIKASSGVPDCKEFMVYYTNRISDDMK